MLSMQERIAKGEEAIAQKRVAGEPVPHEWEVHLARLKALAGGLEPQCSVEPCSVCGGSAYWRSRYGVVVCRVCHPPADPALVAEWVPPLQQPLATPSAGGHGGDR